MKNLRKKPKWMTTVLTLFFVQFLFSTALLADDGPFEKPMKAVGAAMKALKAAVAKGDLAVVKTNAEIIAKNVATVRTFEPPINKDKKDQLPGLADKAVAAANALATVTNVADAKAKYQELGKRCKACHDLFEPPDE